MNQDLLFPPDEIARYQLTFDYPTDVNIKRLTPTEFEHFIFYLFKRDGLYHPVLVGGPGDGGVDVELHSRNGVNPQLCGVVQCKRFLVDKVAPKDLAPLIVAASNAKAERRYCFATSGYTPQARSLARTNDVSLFDCSDIHFWILDIRRREALQPDFLALPDPEKMLIPVISITNNKGGVGKTTITGNMAAALATDQYGVLVIDADPQGHLTYWLTNQQRYPGERSLYAVLTQETPVHALMLKTSEKGVWVLPSSRELNELPNGFNLWTIQRRLAHALANLPLFDPPIRYILIDTPPALNMLTGAALLAATSLLIPLQYDMFSMEGLNELLLFIDNTEKVHHKKTTHILGGITTMVDMRFRWGFKYWEKFKLEDRPRLLQSGLTADKFWCGVLRDRGDFRKAQGDHQSVLTFAKSSDAADDIRKLSMEVIDRVPVLIHHND